MSLLSHRANVSSRGCGKVIQREFEKDGLFDSEESEMLLLLKMSVLFDLQAVRLGDGLT